MHVEMYFDFSCPYAYIAASRIETVCRRAGAELRWRPMLLGGVFRATGAGTPMSQMNPAKARHNSLDMHRWAEYQQVPLTMPAGHPLRTVRALRALLSLPEAAWPPVIHAVYRAYWQQSQDISQPEVVAAALAEAGVTPEAVERALAANDDPAIKDELHARTAEAASRGVFGAPTMFVHVPGAGGPYMFWGQDRLHMVAAVLAGWRPDAGTPPPTPAAPAQGEEGAQAHAQPQAEPRTLHFWYDVSSPFAYLASTQIETVAARAGARLVWRPMLLGGLFRELGTSDVPLFQMIEPKRRYMNRDLEHWAAYWGVPFRFASRFPVRTVTALRLALLAGERIAELSQALFRVLWVEDGDVDDHATLERVLTQHGFDAAAMLARTQDPAIKQALADNTAAAHRAGVFGAPTMIVEDPASDMLFWGQDRLELVSAVLAGC